MKRLVMWMLASVLTLTVHIASAADLVLGAGDVVKTSVYGNPDLQTETRVNDSGSMSFPLLGQVMVAGLTVPAAEKKIAGLLESGGFLRKPQVTLIVTAILSQQVSVLGQVNRPGRYPLEAKRSVLDLLALAGGIAADGGDTLSLIQRRNGETQKTTVDVIEMVRTGRLDKDIELSAGDIIYAERAPRFYIYGEVQRPGMFRLERNMSVVQALSAGGGLNARGTERGIQIKRRDASGVTQIFTAKPDDLLMPDDVVFVKESWF